MVLLDVVGGTDHDGEERGSGGREARKMGELASLFVCASFKLQTFLKGLNDSSDLLDTLKLKLSFRSPSRERDGGWSTIPVVGQSSGLHNDVMMMMMLKLCKVEAKVYR